MISDSFKADNNDILTNPLLISNAFCKYFTEIGSKFASRIPRPNKPFHEHMTPLNNASLFLHPTDNDEVFKTIMSLKAKTSFGHDKISSKLIKLLANSIAVPLSKIINTSLSTGTVPQSWKLAKVIPIYKSKEKSLMNNYRPISLLPSMSKILEKIIHHRLYKFCQAKGILYNKQYGFRPNHSTIHAITDFVANIMRAIENNQFTVSVLLDLSKAFDTIDHNILLSKLSHYGIRGVALEWFRSYLSERTQYVAYKDANSTRLNISCGVPQGSVLGPLLFIIYTNDLPNCLQHSQCILFADDTTLYKSSINVQDLITSIQSDLTALHDWFNANKLSLNVTKTNFMIFSPKSTNKHPTITNIQLGNQTIERVNSAKFVGLFIDDGLQWDEHIKYLSCKLSSGSYAIHSAKRTLSMQNLTQLYNSLFHSHISYGITLWGSAFKYKLRKLEVSQIKSIQSICNAPYNAQTIYCTNN